MFRCLFNSLKNKFLCLYFFLKSFFGLSLSVTIAAISGIKNHCDGVLKKSMTYGAR